MIYFTKIYLLKGLKPKNNGNTNFYECCDLTKKVYLQYFHTSYSNTSNFIRFIKSPKHDVALSALKAGSKFEVSPIEFWNSNHVDYTKHTRPHRLGIADAHGSIGRKKSS